MAATLDELLADPLLCARLGEAGYRKVMARYTWDHVSRAVYSVYQQVLERTTTL